MNDVWQRARDGEHTAQTETVLRLPHGHFSSKSSSQHNTDVTCTRAFDIRSQEALCIAYWGVFISAATQTHRKNCAVNDSDGREVWRSRPTEAHVNKELCMAWDLTVASS